MTSFSSSQFPDPASGDNSNEQALRKLEHEGYSDPIESSAPTPFLKVSAVSFFQVGNSNSPIKLDFPYQNIPPALIEASPFIVEVIFELTTGGRQKLIQQSKTSVDCQVQAFTKPLSPIRSTGHWRETASLSLSPAQNIYVTCFQSVSLGAGIYSLQILLLIRELPASPLLLEVPVLQIT